MARKDSYSTPEKQSDKQTKPDDANKLLLQRFIDGDDSAFDELYMQWFAPIRNTLRYITGTDQDAEDITQDVFADLWKSRDKIDVSKGAKTYIFSSARYKALDLHRKRRAADNYLDNGHSADSSEENTHGYIETRELELIVEQTINAMPAQRRDIYRLSYKEGLSPAEISQKLLIPAEIVSDHLYMARKNIKKALQAAMVMLVFGVMS